jgi:hypothetical protein
LTFAHGLFTRSPSPGRSAATLSRKRERERASHACAHLR